MRVIAWSLHYPRLVLATWALIVVAALGALAGGLVIQLNPALPPNMVMVVAQQMGHSVSDTEQVVTMPLERALQDIEGLRAHRSQTLPGMVMLTLEFDYRKALGPSLEQVRARILAMDELKGWQLEARPMEPLRPALLHLALHHPLPEQLQWLEQTGLPQLRQLSGVASVHLLGQPEPIWEIMVDPQRLQRHGLTLEDLYHWLKSLPVEHGLGELRTSTAPTRALVAERNELEQDPGSQRVRERPRRLLLRELAEVMRSDNPTSPRYRHNGARAVQICVQALPEASTPGVLRRVENWIEQAEAVGLKLEIAFDGSHLLRRMLWDFGLAMALGLALLTLSLYLFLGEARGVLIALATPLASLALTLVCLFVLGFSLNSSTLVGLLLACGRLVDDTILDLDAVRRQLARGRTAAESALLGCSEVRRAVVSSTLVTLLAALVLTRVGGVVQDMFEAIAWAYGLALVASLTAAVTLTPVLAAWVYSRAGLLPAPGGEGLRRRYRAGLQEVLRHPGSVLGLAVAACYLSLVMLPRIGYEMMPLADTGQFIGFLEGPPGSSRDQVERLAQGVEKLLLRQPEVQDVSCEVAGTTPIGVFSGHGQMAENSATFLVTLGDDRRRRALWELADAVQSEARRQYPQLRRLTFKELGADMMASASAPLELVLRGPELARLSRLGEQMLQLAPSVGVVTPATSWQLGQPQLVLRGVSDRNGTRLGLGGGQLERSGLSAHPWMLSYRPAVRRSPADLEGWSQGTTTSLTSERIDHDQGQRSLTVMGFYRKGTGGSMQLQMNWLMAARMQLAIPSNYQLELRGDMVLMMDSFARLTAALALAVVLIYLILGLQFASFTLPLVLLASIPMELPGVVLGLLLTGQGFSSVSLLGLVVLHGMDLTASLLLVDAVWGHKRTKGSLEEALCEALPRRLLPILLTATITVGVLLPLVLTPGGGFDAYAPLVTVIVGGLLSSTFLSLWVTPVLLRLHGGFARSPDEQGATAQH